MKQILDKFELNKIERLCTKFLGIGPAGSGAGRCRERVPRRHLHGDDDGAPRAHGLAAAGPGRLRRRRRGAARRDDNPRGAAARADPLLLRGEG